MKSVYQILKEYRNRLKNPKYAKIHVINYLGNESIHLEVTNIKVTYKDGYEWLEFDRVANLKKNHAKIWAGQVSEYYEDIKE